MCPKTGLAAFYGFCPGSGSKLYTYLSARMIPVIACATFLIYWYYGKITFKSLLVRLTVALCVTVLLMMPLLMYYMAHLNTLTARTR